MRFEDVECRFARALSERERMVGDGIGDNGLQNPAFGLQRFESVDLGSWEVVAHKQRKLSAIGADIDQAADLDILE